MQKNRKKKNKKFCKKKKKNGDCGTIKINAFIIKIIKLN